MQQLVGFARVALAPNQTRRVRFLLDQSQRAFYDAAMRFVIEPGEMRVLVGAWTLTHEAEPDGPVATSEHRLRTSGVECAARAAANALREDVEATVMQNVGPH